MAASVGYHSPNPPDGREAPALQAFPRLCGRGRAGPQCASTSLGAGRPSRRARSGPEPSEGFAAAGRGAAASGRELRQVCGAASAWSGGRRPARSRIFTQQYPASLGPAAGPGHGPQLVSRKVAQTPETWRTRRLPVTPRQRDCSPTSRRHWPAGLGCR